MLSEARRRALDSARGFFEIKRHSVNLNPSDGRVLDDRIHPERLDLRMIMKLSSGMNNSAGHTRIHQNSFPLLGLFLEHEGPNVFVKLRPVREPPAVLTALETESVGLLSTAGRASELGLEWLRMRADTLGRALLWCKRRVGSAMSAARVDRVPVGDMGFRTDHVNLGMPRQAARMLSRFDYGEIKRRRRENFAQLRAQLKGKVDLLDRDLEPGM